MGTVVLDVGHVVAGLLQGGRVDPAAAPDRDLLVGDPVRNEDPRRPGLHVQGQEAGGRGDDVADDVAVGQAERQGIAAAIGVTGEGEVRGIEREAVGDHAQGRVQAFAVGPVAGDHDVPGRKDRLRHQQQETAGLGVALHHRKDLFGVTAAAVEQHHQRRGGGRIDLFGHHQNGSTLARQAERVLARRERRFRGRPVGEGQAAGELGIEHAP